MSPGVGCSSVAEHPMFSKRCFLNGVFQSGVFRAWSGSRREEGTKMKKNTGVFGHLLPL